LLALVQASNSTTQTSQRLKAQKGLGKIQWRLLTALFLAQSLLGLCLFGFESTALPFQLGHPGLELRHSADRHAALGQLPGGLLGQLHQSLQNNTAL